MRDRLVAWGVCLTLAVAGVAWGQGGAGTRVRITASDYGTIAPRDLRELEARATQATPMAGAPTAVMPPAAPAAPPAVYTVMHAEFTSAQACAALSSPKVHVLSRYDKWADVMVPSGDQAAREAVTRAPGIYWVDINRTVQLPPPPAPGTAASRAPAEPIVRGGLQGLTGKGTIVAVIDSGIDFRHPDFITTGPDGKKQSRIRAIWDTVAQPAPGGPGRPGPVTFPNGAPVGTLYLREDLEADLNGTPRIPQLDTNGHGTSCAGIAAGSGMALPDRRYAGVAPAAEIIGVRIGPGPALPNTYLLGAICDWIDQVAGATPTVLSCSFGGQFGGRDGQRIQERQLDGRFPATRPGRALCIAAGNEGADLLHAEGAFAGSDSPATLTWNVPAGTTTGMLEIYFNSAQTDFTLQAPPGSTLNVRGGTSYRHRLTQQIVWSVALPAGPGELKVFSPMAVAGRLDAYIYGIGGGKRAVFTGECAVPQKQVATPGTASMAITVGSYDWNNEFESTRGALVLADGTRTTSDGKPAPIVIGGISSYTNAGYTRLGQPVKPEIAAPGQYHVAAALTTAPTTSLLHPSRLYRPFNGTSSATPYVAGLLALALEKKPGATCGELRRALTQAASQDRFTGPVPNPRWGYGKMDLAAARKLLENIR